VVVLEVDLETGFTVEWVVVDEDADAGGQTEI